jgi:hypothetical protein
MRDVELLLNIDGGVERANTPGVDAERHKTEGGEAEGQRGL